MTWYHVPHRLLQYRSSSWSPEQPLDSQHLWKNFFACGER
jgi:hypothetical protein